MKNLGDITKLNGAEIPVVDIITGGSPCQNLSQAGNRKGLEGDESKLFFEQIRIIKEMREHDRSTGRTGFLIRPRYAVWENNRPHRGGGELSAVRRLTVTECERLQGFEDGWTDIGDWTDSSGKLHKAADSPRYRALGNSIALPFWKYLARRICAQYERDMTMGSLFDGIGGFPIAFEQAGAKALWASEIDEFCIAVTKEHFGEE